MFGQERYELHRAHSVRSVYPPCNLGGWLASLGCLVWIRKDGAIVPGDLKVFMLCFWEASRCCSSWEKGARLQISGTSCKRCDIDDDHDCLCLDTAGVKKKTPAFVIMFMGQLECIRWIVG